MRILTELMSTSLGEELWTEHAKSGWEKVSKLIGKGIGDEM